MNYANVPRAHEIAPSILRQIVGATSAQFHLLTRWQSHNSVGNWFHRPHTKQPPILWPDITLTDKTSSSLACKGMQLVWSKFCCFSVLTSTEAFAANSYLLLCCHLELASRRASTACYAAAAFFHMLSIIYAIFNVYFRPRLLVSSRPCIPHRLGSSNCCLRLIHRCIFFTASLWSSVN